MTVAADPYTQPQDAVKAAPTSVRERLRYLGPSVIVSGSIVGSGEILLTSSLGASVGFVMLWWVLVSCWSKSLVQAELGRYVITTGDTYLRAMNRLPGKLPGPRQPIAWPLWLGLIAYVPGVMSAGGIIGGAGQAASLLLPGVSSNVAAGVLVVLTMVILGTGAYARLERSMLALVICFTLITLTCAVLMQFTDLRMTSADLASGFTFEFPVEYAVLALAMYGYTGVNSGEISAYTYWCVEKGYPGFVGADRSDPAWVARAQGWLSVLRTDVWVTLVLLTLATLPFYLLGAGVLHPQGARPEGLDTIRVLSGMFTGTLGPWAVWLFGLGAFFILFSTTLASMAVGGRVLPDYLVELGFLERFKVHRERWVRGYILVMPVLAFLMYLWLQSPVALVSVAAMIGACMLPIQTGATLWLQAHHMDARVRPGRAVQVALWAVLVFQLLMAGAVVWFVVL